MIAIAHRIANRGLAAAVALSTMLAVSCVPFSSSPQQTQASNPTVTYTYHSDDELIQTNQLAATFCNRYQNTTPRPLSFTKDSSGERVVAYECVPTSISATRSSNPNLSYTYRTDQELVDVSRSARAYCFNTGSSQVASNIVSNGDGTKTVTFQCRPN